MLGNTRLVVDYVGKSLEGLGFYKNSYTIDRFFRDEFSRKLICKDDMEVASIEGLSVRYNHKDDKFRLETTWSNLEVTDKLFDTISKARNVVIAGNGMLDEYK